MSDMSPEILTSLAQKLDGLDLSEAEQAALDHILERAQAYEPEVEGFGMSMQYSGFGSGVDLTGTAFKLGAGLGLIGGGPGTRMEMEFGGGKFRPPPP